MSERELAGALKESQQTIAFLENILEATITAIAATQGHEQGQLDKAARGACLRYALEMLDKYSAYQMRKGAH